MGATFLATAVLAAPIHDAAKSGDVAALTAELDAGADANQSDGAATPLYYAVTKQHLKAAELLIARGADVNLVTRFGQPVLNAAWNGDAAMLQLLIKHGADRNSSFKTETALHLAAQRGYLACVEILVAAGADVNALTRFREPPIHHALRGGHEAVASYLRAHGYVTPQVPPISARLATADLKRGDELYIKECSRCHDAGPEQRSFRGPPLWNIVDRPPAAIDGFNYSPVMKSQKERWSYETLNHFLSDPSRVMPGMDMGSNGLQEAQDRADLIAYLRTRSNAPVALPTE